MAGDSSDEEETFVTYGTPVEILDEDAPRKKPLLIEDQVVTDTQGRRRFHGAFSGGFSAGYYNTVGSEKGWAPSSFVSSRSQKQGKTQQRPEDFMDDDDFGEYGIAPRKITTTDTYDQPNSSENSKKRAWHEADGGVIPGQAPLQDLIQPNRESVGIQLLRKMGWRHGQGIGPRQKKRQGGKKMYGCSMPQTEEDQSSEDEFVQDHFFAPKDIDSFKFRAKDDLHGIGYRGIDARTAMYGGHEHVNLFEDESIASKSSSGRLGIRGKAFGVGAFEDQDDDIYAADHMSNYDQFIGEEIPSAKANKTSKSKFHSASHVSKLLEGFTLSANSKPPNKVYHPPDLPRGYEASHVMKNIQPAGPKFTSKLFTMSAIQRGALLGEEQLPAPEVQPIIKKPTGNLSKPTVDPSQATKQTSDLSQLPKPTPTDINQDDITAAVASLVSAQRAKMESRFAKPSQPIATEISSVPTPSTSNTTIGFKPFAKDPAKQQRYEKFLASKGRGADTVAADTLTEWERRRENDEFTRASLLYRPLSSTMASRFTTAKHADDEDGKVDVPAEQESEKEQHAKAAEMKMFGRLTRDTFEWHPDRLLCKRFNIPDPYPGSSIIGLPTVKKDKLSLYNFMSIPSHEERCISENQEIKHSSPVTVQQTVASPPERKTLPIFQSSGIFSNLSSVQKVTVTEEASRSKQPEDEESVDEKRPPMDLFKAIFQDESSEDSEESSDDEDEEMMDGEENETNKEREKDQLKKGSEQIKEIFPAAKCDEEILPQSSLSMKEHNKTPEIDEVEKKTVNNDVYGPALPPPSNENVPSLSSSSEPTKDMLNLHKHKHLYVHEDKRYGKRNKDNNYGKEKSSEETSKRHSGHEHLEKKQKHKHRKKEKHRGKHKKEKKPKKSKRKSKHKHAARTRHGSDSEHETSTDSYSSDN